MDGRRRLISAVLVDTQVPPTNGWMLELGYSSNDDGDDDDFKAGELHLILPSFFVRFPPDLLVMTAYCKSQAPPSHLPPTSIISIPLIHLPHF